MRQKIEFNYAKQLLPVFSFLFCLQSFSTFNYYEMEYLEVKNTEAVNKALHEASSSKYQITEKFIPPSHPAYLITHNFQSSHVQTLQDQMDKHFISLGMQTSKKKLMKVPETPNDRYFIIVDDSAGPVLLEGEFLTLSCRKIFYPYQNNVEKVIKQFNQYVGLGHYERNQSYENDKRQILDEDYLKELQIRKLKNLKSIGSKQLENPQKGYTDIFSKQSYLAQNATGVQTSLGQRDGKSKIKLQGVKSLIEEKGIQKFDGGKIFVFESKDDDLAYREMVSKLKKQVQQSKNTCFINRIDQFNFYSQRHKNEYLVLLMSSYSLLNLKSYFKKIHESVVYWTSETQRIHSNQTKRVTFYSMIEKEILTYILSKHSQLNKEQTPVSTLKPLELQKNKIQLALSPSQNQNILQKYSATSPVPIPEQKQQNPIAQSITSQKKKLYGEAQVQQKKKRQPKIKLLEVTDLHFPKTNLENKLLMAGKDQLKQQKQKSLNAYQNDKKSLLPVNNNGKKTTFEGKNQQINPYEIMKQSNKNLASIESYEGYRSKSKIKKVRSNRKIKDNFSKDKDSKQKIIKNSRLNHLRASSDKKDQSPISPLEHKRIFSTESNQLGIPIPNKTNKMLLNFVSDSDNDSESDYHISTHPPCQKIVTISHLNIDDEEMEKNNCKVVKPQQKFETKFKMNDQQKYEKMMKGQEKDNICLVLPIDEDQQKHRIQNLKHNIKQKSKRTFEIVKEQKYQHKSVDPDLQKSEKLMIGLIGKAADEYIGTKNVSIINNQAVPPSFVQLTISSVSSFSQNNLIKKIQSINPKRLMRRPSVKSKSKKKQSPIRYKLNLLNQVHQQGLNEIIFSDSQSQSYGNLKIGSNRYSFGNVKQKNHVDGNLNIHKQPQIQKDSQYFSLLTRDYSPKRQSKEEPENYERKINEYGLPNNRHKQKLATTYLQQKRYDSNQQQPTMLFIQDLINSQKNSAYLNDKVEHPMPILKLPTFRTKSKSYINTLKISSRNNPVQKNQLNLDDQKDIQNFQLNSNRINHFKGSNYNNLNNSGASQKSNYGTLPKYSRVKSKDTGAYLDGNRKGLKIEDINLHSKLFVPSVDPISIDEIEYNETKPRAMTLNRNIIDLSEYDKCIENGVTVYRKRIPISVTSPLVDQLVSKYTLRNDIPRQIIKAISPEAKIKQRVNFYLSKPQPASATSYITPIQYLNLISKKQSQQEYPAISINPNKSIHQNQTKLVPEQFNKISDAKQKIQADKIAKDSLFKQKNTNKNLQKYGFIYHQKKKVKKFDWTEESQILFLIDKLSSKQIYAKVRQLTTEKDTMVSFKNIHQLNNQILQSEVIYDLVFIFSQSNNPELKVVSKKFANCYLVRQISELPSKIKSNRIYLNSLDQFQQIISQIWNKSNLKQNRNKGQGDQGQRLKFKPKYSMKMCNPHFSARSCCLESYQLSPKSNCRRYIQCGQCGSPGSLIN